MELRILLKSKIHNATVTRIDRDYIGSITIDPDLMDKADLWHGEQVLVLNDSNGARIETYVIPGARGSGEVCINGPATHLIKEGDKVIVMAFKVASTRDDPKIVLVDEKNRFRGYLRG